MKRTLRRCLISLALPLVVAACSQDSGESCQLDGDCSSGLMCCKGATDRGVCKPACETAATTTESDAGADASTSSDAAMSGGDSGVEPMSMDDAGDSDAG